MRTLLLLLCLLPLVAGAQDYPAKPVRVVVGTSPGGSPDVFARLVTTKMAEAWGATFLVENKIGANGNIAAEMVSRSAPDGYTLVLGNSESMVFAPVTMAISYNALTDFEPVALLPSYPFLLVTTNDVAFLGINTAQYTFLLGPDGSVIADAIPSPSDHAKRLGRAETHSGARARVIACATTPNGL